MMKDERGIKVDSTVYKQIVGSLMYMTATRPDIMYVISLISMFIERPTELHLKAANGVLRYLKGTVSTHTVIMLEIRMIGRVLQVMHGHSKHIDVRFHFLRELTKNEVVELVQCSTQE
ncbi:uncharacterized protein LOC126601493 [Malus sylvestris]|uniref:uncharacterized protein LOC126601493 n=1 Tax=Malus sylvestris TaxID=3752 RepID=UPI0021ABF694|nr:uncharacterized protein LOC126601493 [Malus sylvestris]